MRSISFIFGSAMLALITGVTSAHSSPPSVTNWQIRGDGAFASAYGDTECGWINVGVTVDEQVRHESGGGPPVETSGAWVGFSSFDWCTQTERYGFAFVSGLPVSADLDQAAFQGSIVVDSYTWQQDADGNWQYIHIGSSTLDVNVTWVGIGEVFSGMSFQVSRYGKDAILRNRWRGQQREATITLEARLDGALLDLPSVYGTLGSYRIGDTQIIHNSN